MDTIAAQINEAYRMDATLLCLQLLRIVAAVSRLDSDNVYRFKSVCMDCPASGEPTTERIYCTAAALRLLLMSAYSRD
jgi:hypothetical protein